jgi:hypothetical protein
LFYQLSLLSISIKHNTKAMEDYVLTVPFKDKSFIEALASRMGWRVRTRRSTVERFINSCPKSPVMTDDEIAAEVNAVRFGA